MAERTFSRRKALALIGGAIGFGAASGATRAVVENWLNPTPEYKVSVESADLSDLVSIRGWDVHLAKPSRASDIAYTIFPGPGEENSSTFVVTTSPDESNTAERLLLPDHSIALLPPRRDGADSHVAINIKIPEGEFEDIIQLPLTAYKIYHPDAAYRRLGAKVVSAIDLEQDYPELAKSYMDMLTKIYDPFFLEFVPQDYHLYVMPSGRDEQRGDASFMPQDMITNPAYPKQAEIEAFLLITSAALENHISEHDQNIEHLVELNRATQAFYRSPDYTNYLNNSLVDYTDGEQPLMDIFMRYHYGAAGQDQSDREFTGTQYYYPKNLFAAALTILRFYPEKFLESYEALSESDKTIVKDVCQGALNAFEVSYFPELSGQPSMPDRWDQILPEFARLQKAMDLKISQE